VEFLEVRLFILPWFIPKRALQTAGGYDAIWLLVCDPIDCSPDQHPTERVEHVWSNYKDLDVSPLSTSESTISGSRLEKLEDVPGLKEAVSIE
jgi:phosphomevalonate kinase